MKQTDEVVVVNFFNRFLMTDSGCKVLLSRRGWELFIDVIPGVYKFIQVIMFVSDSIREGGHMNP